MESGMRGGRFWRASFAAFVIAAASASLSPALAQVTLRMDPNQVAVDPTSGAVSGFDIFVDGLASTDMNGDPIGITSFSLQITFTDQPPHCLLNFGGTLDSALVTQWGGLGAITRNFTSPDPNNRIFWTARTNNPGIVGPSGSVKLGRISFTFVDTTPIPAECRPAINGDFDWDETMSLYATARASGNSPATPFGAYVDGPWLKGSIPDVDLTIACDSTALVNAGELTLRFDPVPLVIDQDANSFTSVSIFLDNVPAMDANGTLKGLTGFSLALDVADRLDCLDFFDGTLDPNLETDWGGSASVQSNPVEDPNQDDRVTWTAFTNDTFVTGPSGSVRLGEMRFRLGPDPNQAAACEAALAGDGQLDWDAALTSHTTERAPANTDPNFNLPITTLRDVRWGLDAAPFVDGDTITLDCTTTNGGSAAITGAFPEQTAVISADADVDSADTVIARSSLGVSLKAGESARRIFTGSPAFNGIGALRACAKTDTNPADLSEPNGVIRWESDELNNTDCLDAQILFPLRDIHSDPNTLAVTPGPLDPNFIHAGNIFTVGYDITNEVAVIPAGQGNALVRGHTNAVYLSDDATIDPNSDLKVCEFVEPDSPGIAGGATSRRTFGVNQDPNDTVDDSCDIPFEAASSPTGLDYFIGVVFDSKNNVSETSEANNRIATVMGQVTVYDPLPPDLRPARREDLLDTRAEIRGSFIDPNITRVPLTITGVRDLGSYSVKFSWSDPNQITILNPATGITFSTFLEANGRVQACTKDTTNLASGTVILACTTTGSGAGAKSSSSENLVNMFFTALSPGDPPGIGGDFIIDPDPNVTFARDPNGNDIPMVLTDGTFVVTGVAELFIENPGFPPEIYPGRKFQTDYDIRNKGFGAAAVGTKSEVILSPDPMVDPDAGDPVTCFRNEPSAIQPFATEPVSLTNCVLPDDLRPGLYTGGVRVKKDPPEIQSLELPSRIFAIRESGETRTLQTFAAPASIGGSTGPAFASAKSFKPRSLATLKSASRNVNFTVGWKSSSTYPRLDLFRTPHKLGQRFKRLASLRIPKNDKAVLSGADIDGDGEDEFVLIEKRQGKGDVLDFHVVDYKLRIPIMCVSMAKTEPFADRVIDVASISYDADPEDEIVVVTEAGNGTQTLAVYDVTLPGGATLPPSTACTEVTSPIPPPVILDSSGFVMLASDTDIGGPGDKVLSICGMDFGLDGVDEVVTLQGGSTGPQALRVLELPAFGMNGPGTTVLLTDDAAFGGGGKDRVLTIDCTR